MQRHVAIQRMVKKLALIFYGVFRVFMFLNMLLLGLSLYIMVIAKNGVGTFLFIVFFVNFWIMMTFFCLLSMFIKLFICMIHEDALNTLDEDYSWVLSVIFFPLLSEGDEGDFIQAVALHSFDEDEQTTTQPPTTDRLCELETKWNTIWKDSPPPDEKKEDPCLICAHPYSHQYPTHQGCVELTCSCATLFHKKCVLEWFHFNEKPDQNDESKSIVSCPSCRHVFTTS